MITDTKSLPAGTQYFSVSEEVWFPTGPEDADRDFLPIGDFEVLTDAIEAVKRYVGSNRIYIDLMTKQENGSSWGAKLWAGRYINEIEKAKLKILCNSGVL